MPETPRDPLTVDDVAKVADLAMLNLDDADLEQLRSQLDAVLDLAQTLSGFDIEGVPPTSHPFGLVNVFRADTAESVDVVRDEALAAGPDVEEGRYKVPPALGEEL